jgi:hypothetical protein
MTPDQEPKIGQVATVVEPPIGQSASDASAPPNLSASAHPAIAAGVGQFFSDLSPVSLAETIASNPGDPIGAVLSAIGQSSKEHAKAGVEAMKNGDHAAATAHFVGSIPVVGPVFDQLMTSVRNRDEEGTARALGSMAALAAPAVVSGGASAAGEAAAPAIARAAESRAVSNVAESMAPMGNWGKSGAGKQFFQMAQEAAPDVLAAKPPITTLSRGALADFVTKQFTNSSQAWETAEDARFKGSSLPTAPIIVELQKKLDAITAHPIEGSQVQRTPVTTTSSILAPTAVGREASAQPIQTTTLKAEPIGKDVPKPNTDAQRAVLQDAITRLKQLGPIARYDDLRTLRQGYDLGADYKPSPLSTPEEKVTSQQNSAGNSGAAGAIRDALAKDDPNLAKKNAQFSIWKNAQDVVAAADELNRTQAKGGTYAVVSKITPILLGGGAGAATGIPGGAEIGGFIGGALKMAQDAGVTTKVAVARGLSDLSDAIKSGNTAKLFRSVAAIAAATGTQVPVLSQSLAGLPNPVVNTGQAVKVGGS